MGAGLVVEEVLLLRALALSCRAAAFASFQKRKVNESPQARGVDGGNSSGDAQNLGSFMPAGPGDRLDST